MFFIFCSIYSGWNNPIKYSIHNFIFSCLLFVS
nr:MAG TPA: hypothetical protein [Caudoviricetes sp.]